MNYAGNIEIIRKHFHDHQENLCIAVLSIIYFAQNIFNKGYFYSRRFKKYSRTSLETEFKEFSRISHNVSIFKDFSRPVQTV